MLRKILVALSVALSVVGASAQIIETYPVKIFTLRMEDHLNGTVFFEQTRYDERTRTGTVRNLNSGAWVMTWVEAPDGKSAVTTHPYGKASFVNSMPLRLMQPGQQASGYVDLAQRDMPNVRLTSITRVTREGSLDVVEMNAFGHGHSMWTRIEFPPGERITPERMETIYRLNGQLVNHLRGARVLY